MNNSVNFLNIAIIIICSFEYIHYFLYQYELYNSNEYMILSPSIYIYNKSLGLHNVKCIKNKKYLYYNNNRRRDNRYSAILPIILWYSHKVLNKAAYHAIELIRSLCNPINSNIAYAILSVDINISFIFDNISYLSYQNCSKYNLCKRFLNLDYEYRLYSIGGEYKCTIIYGCFKQKIFSPNFVRSTILTPYNECIFSGRYASAVNLYPALPFILKIFDYFDYIIKYDIDNIVGNTSLNLNFKLAVKRKYELAGCNLVNDNKILSSNIFKMIFMYISNLSMKCNEPLLGKGFSQNFVQNENVVLHGRLTVMWLGLYSSPEVYDFLNYYLSYKDGIYKYRWGDQQFYLNALLLFSSKDKLGFIKSKLCNMHDIKMF